MRDKDVDTQKQKIRDFIKTEVTRDEKLIIVLYHYEEMTFWEIAKVLELSESRVSRMHASIIQDFKNWLSDGADKNLN